MSGESGDQEMNQDDRRKYLIEGLLKERPEYENMQIPSDAGKQKILLRSLMNIRMPKKMDYAFLQRHSLIFISGRAILQDLEWEQS